MPEMKPTPVWPGALIWRCKVQPDSRISDITNTINDTVSRTVSLSTDNMNETDRGRAIAAPSSSAATRRQSTWPRIPRA